MNLKSRKGITGADIASAITIIVLTVGIVTGIYVNAINKSKDNIRYANAVRIATNIIENIQKNPYEILIAICSSTGERTLVGDGSKVFDTKIPKGFSVTIKAVKSADVDIARDVTVNVKYKASMTHKTVTLNTVKEKELMDISNSPDISLVPGYNTAGNYFYPVKNTESNTYVITTTDDIGWYNYDTGSEKTNYALIYKTTDVLNVGETKTITPDKIYAWVPRYVEKDGTGIGSVQFLYGTSEYKITLNKYNDNLISYGLNYSGIITATSLPNKYDTGFAYHGNSFAQNDGLSGVWYNIGGIENSAVTTNAYNGLNSKLPINIF